MAMWKATENIEDCFLGPVVKTVKKDKSVKIALNSRKLNEITVKRTARVLNMEELLSRYSRKISQETDSELLTTKLDFD